MTRHGSHSSWHAVLPFVLGLWAGFWLLVLRARGILRRGSMQRFLRKSGKSSATTRSDLPTSSLKPTPREQPQRWPFPDQVITTTNGRPPWDPQKAPCRTEKGIRLTIARPASLYLPPVPYRMTKMQTKMPTGEIRLMGSLVQPLSQTIPTSGLPRNWQIPDQNLTFLP